jgi:NAD(P)-dependent dehydrogenase (short-subunit alcohol dehydrogenase family)
LKVDLANKCILVTGAGSGIGAACARRLAESGASVWVNDLDKEAAESVAKEIGGHALVGDVADPGTWIGPILDRPSLHGIVHNAGYDLWSELESMDRRQAERLHHVMVSGPLQMTQLLLEPLRRAQGACVLFIASIHSRVTESGMISYAAAKGAQVAMVNALSQDLGRYQIRALSVSPGYIDTPIMSEWLAGTNDPVMMRKKVEAIHPLGRIGRPEDVANLVAFLISPLASFMTGTNVVIDGGISTKLLVPEA